MHVLFRRCYRLPVGPQQEADDLLFEWTSAAARETGLLLGHVSPHTKSPLSSVNSYTLSHSLSFCPSLFPSFLHSFLYSSRFFLVSNDPLVFPSPLCLSGLVSLQQPALCPTSSVSLTLGPSLFVTHRLSSSAPSTTSLHCCPVKRSSYPGETWSCSALCQRRKGMCNLLFYPTVLWLVNHLFSLSIQHVGLAWYKNDLSLGVYMEHFHHSLICW